MTVQELIDVLNKIEDKSKDVINFDCTAIEEVEEFDYEVVINYKIMTKNKELLLKDICGRLPYDIKVLYNNKVYSVDYISGIYEEIKLDNSDNYTLNITEIKPYLFPLSSMTREQLFEVQEILGKNEIETKDGLLHIIDSERNTISYSEITTLLEWFYKNHFDINNLIPMKLAIDATGLNIY